MIFPELEEAVSTNLTKSEKERADNYIENFRKNESVYAPISEHSSSFYHRLTDLINSAKYRSEGLPESVIKKFTEPLLKYAGKRIQASMYEKNHTTDTAISKGEYIFYPIQYSVESRITLRAPDFYDQSNLVEFINRNLPLNTQRLLVKDHPNNIGHLSLWAAYHMSKRSVFVHPKTCTHKIIKNSDAVITLNNTVGHEAIMWQKPVIVLGDALYSGLGLTYDVKNISNFSNVAKKAIEEGGPTMKEVRRYVNGLYKVGDKVNMDDTSDKAVTRTVESILQRTKTS
jgi:capsule polysaccharide export protein KpsC/LpsZ